MTEIAQNASGVPSIKELKNWEGGFPGKHEFSTLDGLERQGGLTSSTYSLVPHSI